MPLTHLGCPSCGGALSLEEGARIVACRYCGSSHLVLATNAVPRYAAALGAGQEEACAVARAALRRSGVPQALRAGVRFGSVSLCYVPFYEVTAVRLGRFFLRERVKPPPPLGDGGQADAALQRWLEQPATETASTRVVEQDISRISPACDLRELGTPRIDLATLRRGSLKVALEPFDAVAFHGRAVVFSPTMPPERFLAESTWRMQVRGDETTYVAQRLKLIYYPVWLARYRHLGRSYEIAVDGVTGGLLRGTAPRDLAAVAGLAVGGAGLAALGLGRFLRGLLAGAPWLGRLLAADSLGAGPLFLLLGLVGCGLGWVGWTWLGRGRELTLTPEDAGVLAAIPGR